MLFFFRVFEIENQADAGSNPEGVRLFIILVSSGCFVLVTASG